MPQVQVIQPIQQQPKRLRVAAYARVSSDSEDQLNSLAVQVDYYTHLIQENPNWEFAGIYTDEGITGTSTKRREQFNRLMDDCRAGLIDRVLVMQLRNVRGTNTPIPRTKTFFAIFFPRYTDQN